MAQVPNVCSFGGEVISTPSDGWMIEATAEKTFVTPERDVEFVEVPGKDGAIVFDNGRYKNIKISIDVIFMPQPQLGEMIAARAFFDLLGRLAQKTGYQKLYLPYRTDAYRLAVYRGSSNGKPSPWYDSATVTLNFECKPYWYMDSGDEVTEHTYAPGDDQFTLYNPTQFYSKPLIRVYGNGVLSLVTGGQTRALVNTFGIDTTQVPYVDIDSEAMTVSYNGTSMGNNAIIYTGKRMPGVVERGFPLLPPGTFILEHTQSKVEITPRWAAL